jgi:eukaryotic-like serine/threonine-protein kinase
LSPPASKIICPGCRAAFDASTPYCSRCGTSLGATPAADRVRKTEPFMAAVASTGPTEDSGPRDLLIGRVIDGRYRVLERIGAGAMGLVYKVEHQRMGKIAAMKVLHQELASDRQVMKRFRREAEAVSRLTHANTVQTFDFGADDGTTYLVMEYVRGEDLGTLVRRAGPLSFARAAPILMQVCEALAEAHELGIVHRDIKPENILVTRDKDGHDHAKVLDFGLAKLMVPDDGPDASQGGQIVGTPYFMAPEQIRGEPLDGRADLYALGGVMMWILTGEAPFQADSPVAILTMHLHDEPVLPTARRPDLPLPGIVDEIVRRALAKDRQARHATALELRAELGAALSELTTPGRPAAGQPSRTTHAATAQARLGRDDLQADARARRLSWWARRLGIPAGIVAVALAALWLRPAPAQEEREPNDDLATATPARAGRPIRGTVAPGDRDHYRLDLGGAGVALSARLSRGSPGLTLLGEGGERLAEAAAGQELTWRGAARTLYVLVEAGGAAAAETYELTIRTSR